MEGGWKWLSACPVPGFGIIDVELPGSGAMMLAKWNTWKITTL
jgi:hypothetical protein